MQDEDFIEIDPADMEEEPVDYDIAFEGFNDDLVAAPTEEQPNEQPMKSDPVHEFVEGLAEEHNMTTDGYLQAVAEAREQQQEQELIEAVMYEYNVTEEQAIEGINEYRQQEQQQAWEQEQARQQEAEAMDFFKEYKRVNGQDWDGSALPSEVWRIQEELKVPLKEAYKEHRSRKQDESFLKGFDSY